MAQPRDVGGGRGLSSGSSSENGQEGMDLRAIMDVDWTRNGIGARGASW